MHERVQINLEGNTMYVLQLYNQQRSRFGGEEAVMTQAATDPALRDIADRAASAIDRGVVGYAPVLE